MKGLRLLGAAYSMSLRRELGFRANLAFDLLSALIGLGSALLVVQVVYSRTDSLLSWSKPEMLVLVGTFQVMTGVKATFIDPNLAWFPGRGIREGRLDTHLLQPAPSLFLASLGTAAPLALVQVGLGLGVVGLGVSQAPSPPGLTGLLAWLLLVAVGVAVTWAIGVVLACLAFWAPRLELEVLYGAAWQLGRYPVDIYRQPLRLLLTYVFPMALISTLPAEVLLNRPAPLALLAAVLGGVAAVLFACGLWRFGVRRYTGATS